MRRKALPGDKVWLFDLDDTLHATTPHVFGVLHALMSDYVERHVGCSREEANALRRRYWLKYGATLQGLVRHHGVDPDDFLRATHPLETIAPLITVARGLRAMLLRLPGRKIVFSNAPRHYVAHFLRQMKIADLFEAVYAIEDSGYRPKPERFGYDRLLRRLRLDPRRCVMVEDSLVNLKTAKRLGMRTVWVHPDAVRVAGVDARVRRVTQLPRQLRRLRR